MKLSGHSFDNDVFSSLLDGLDDSVTVEKRAEVQNQDAVSGMDVFSSITEQNMKGVLRDEVEFIAAELKYAADRSGIQLTADEVRDFVVETKNDRLRGKAIERAARKFCNNIDRNAPLPSSPNASVLASGTGQSYSPNKVHSAVTQPDGGLSDGKTGGYMGQQRNPNSIWDVEALQRKAAVKTQDEKMKEAREKREDFKEDQKKLFWKRMAEKLSDPNNLTGSVMKAGEYGADQAPATDQARAANSMSIFSEDRDFSNIPEATEGESLKQVAEERRDKASDFNKEETTLQPAKRADNLLENLFAELKEDGTLTTQASRVDVVEKRASLDSFFDGLVSE